MGLPREYEQSVLPLRKDFNLNLLDVPLAFEIEISVFTLSFRMHL